jgi:hypothetical protein
MRRRTIHRYHRNHGEGIMAAPTQNNSDPLSSLTTDFLAELAHANRSRHTCRAYATDLAQFAAFYRGPGCRGSGTRHPSSSWSS